MQSFDSFVHNPEVQAQTKLQQKHEYGFLILKWELPYIKGNGYSESPSEVGGMLVK